MASIARILFERLGRRYLAAVYAFQVALVLAVVLAGVAMLFLYEDLTPGEFLRIAAVAEAAVLLESIFALRVAARLLEPVKRWLGGDRDADSTIRAWRALAELPIGFLRRWKLVPPLLTIPPVAVFAALELDASPLGALALLVGAFVVLSYGATLRYFFSEIAMRPLLEDVAGDLPADFDLGRGGVALRLKLLVILPAINVITGVIVAGASGPDDPGVTSLGVDVLMAIAVASTISLELTLLLSKSILDPIGRLRDATERVAGGDLSARVRVISTDETGRLAQSFNRMAAGLEERERLREAFGTFVDPEVAERVMRDGTLLGDELEVSVIFIDIRDFTAFAEQASAREVVERLNDFYERVVPVLARHGGHANKFVGDGLLAVFGAPERLADHADRAVAAALEIAALVRDCYGDELRVGIGVNSGPVLAGTVGGGGRLEFTVIGDPVNTAARVEEATRETGDVVLVTGATRALLSDEPCEFVERPQGVLKGKVERVRLYAPAGLAEEEPAGVEAARTGAA
jgi:adenylate cyclase